MKRFELKDCMEKGLIRRIPPSREKSEGSIRAANKWLEEAGMGIRNKMFNSSAISSYLAMFHSARAVLFLDGFREKSHYCIARYLESRYVNKGLLESRWIELLDHYREQRHENQYNVSFFTTEDEAEKIFRTAGDFLDRMKLLLQKKATGSSS